MRTLSDVSIGNKLLLLLMNCAMKQSFAHGDWLKLGLLLLLVCGSGTLQAQEKLTPSHVYQQTERIIAEIHLLRNSQSVNDTPRNPGVQVHKLPLHVYGKSLELLEKMARTQQGLGMVPVIVGRIPSGDITPDDVHKSAGRVLEELRRMKRHLSVTATIDAVPLVKGMSPSDVYENMWRASYLMDGLAGELRPSRVYRNAEYILDELRAVASHLGTAAEAQVPARVPGKKPKDVNIEAYKSLHRISRLQRKLDMPSLRVPSFPYGKITPSDVYDSTNMLLAELTRIRTHLGIKSRYAERSEKTNITPSHVLTLMQLIGLKLEAMVELL